MIGHNLKTSTFAHFAFDNSLVCRLLQKKKQSHVVGLWCVIFGNIINCPKKIKKHISTIPITSQLLSSCFGKKNQKKKMRSLQTCLR